MRQGRTSATVKAILSPHLYIQVYYRVKLLLCHCCNKALASPNFYLWHVAVFQFWNRLCDYSICLRNCNICFKDSVIRVACECRDLNLMDWEKHWTRRSQTFNFGLFTFFWQILKPMCHVVTICFTLFKSGVSFFPLQCWESTFICTIDFEDVTYFIRKTKSRAVSSAIERYQFTLKKSLPNYVNTGLRSCAQVWTCASNTTANPDYTV